MFYENLITLLKVVFALLSVTPAVTRSSQKFNLALNGKPLTTYI